MAIESLTNNRALVAVFLFLVSFTIFVPSLKSDFLWDDIAFIKYRHNSLKLSNIGSKLIVRDIEDTKELKYFRPIFHISLIIDHEIWGLSPFGFHFSNIIFYSTSTVLFYFLVLLILGQFKVNNKDSIALISSLLFALHPMHVEAVSWIAARADLLCGIFFFSAFIFHILSIRKLAFLIFAAICFFLSLVSKEVAVAFPIVIIGFDLLAHRRIRSWDLVRYALYAALVVLYFYLRGRGYVNIPELSGESVHGSASGIYQAWEILRVLISSYLFYIIKLVFPYRFNVLIATVPSDFYYIAASVLVILFLCLVGFISLKKGQGADAFGIFWIFTTLGPPSLLAVFAIGAAPLAERFLYIPSAGYCMLIGYLLFKAWERVRAKAVVWAFGIILCLSYLSFTVDRQNTWRGNLTLWADTSKKTPFHGTPHQNYGEALRAVGREDEAINELLLVLDPRVRSVGIQKADSANSIGAIYMNRKDYENARKWFLKALYYNPNHGKAYNNLGYIYFKEGEHKKAEHWFLEAAKRDPREKMSYYHLGVIYFIKAREERSPSDYIKAEKYLKEAIKKLSRLCRGKLPFGKGLRRTW